MSRPEPGPASPGPGQACAAGVHAISLPTPFRVGRVNCYLIEDEPLTLVDTGPNSGNSLDELVGALAARGHTVEELGLIIITHQHIDHLGLLEILARRSGAEVAAFHQLAPYLADFGASAAADDEFSMQLMLRHGVPGEVVTALGSVGASFRGFGSSGQVTRPLHDGDELRLANRTLRALHRPGHSPSDTVFLDDQRRLLIGGDHLLAHISSNPLISRPPDGGSVKGRRPQALPEYIASLRATRELDAGVVLTGHGDPILDHRALIDERFRMHDRRAQKLLGMLEPAPLSAYELATRMWGQVAVTQAYLTISEVLGHMDLLAAEGCVAEDPDGEVIRFAAVNHRPWPGL